MRSIGVALSALALADCGEKAKPAAKTTGQTEVDRVDSSTACARGAPRRSRC
jgi:hypothetical protein